MPEGMLGRLPLAAVRGPKDALDERLAGPNGEKWLQELNRFLAKKATWVHEFTIWKTVTIGGIKKRAELSTEIRNKPDHRVDEWIDSFPDPWLDMHRKQEVDLVRISAAYFGFKEPTPQRAVVAKAHERGLQLVELEVGLQLRLQYSDQPNGEVLQVPAMLPLLHDPDKGKCIIDGASMQQGTMILEHSDNLFIIRGSISDPLDKSLLGPNQELVFVLPRVHSYPKR